MAVEPRNTETGVRKWDRDGEEAVTLGLSPTRDIREASELFPWGHWLWAEAAPQV